MAALVANRDCKRSAGGHAAIDIRDRRDWRVHEHDARSDTGVEMIKDLRGIEAGDSDAGEQMAQQPGAFSASSLRTREPSETSAKMTRRPVPADSSSARLSRVIVAAVAAAPAARPRAIGVENAVAPGSLRSGAYGWGDGPRLFPASAAWRRARQREHAWRDRTSAGQTDPPSKWWTPPISSVGSKKVFDSITRRQYTDELPAVEPDCSGAGDCPFEAALVFWRTAFAVIWRNLVTRALSCCCAALGARARGRS
jgi:hypothetical protein